LTEGSYHATILRSIPKYSQEAICEAMMPMKKIDVAAIEAAVRGRFPGGLE
jgi:hypothetical protein